MCFGSAKSFTYASYHKWLVCYCKILFKITRFYLAFRNAIGYTEYNFDFHFVHSGVVFSPGFL